MLKQPIFQPIFGKTWDHLPPALHKHYANRPHSHDVVTAEGVMTIEIFSFMKWLAPLLSVTGALVPYAGENIPTTVYFRSHPTTNAYEFDRTFRFPNKKPYRFRSHMMPVGGDEVIEFMPSGMGWHARYRFAAGKVLMEHLSYQMRLFGKRTRLPLEWFLGRGNAYEEATGDDSFRMYMDIVHPLFGRVYIYRGEFRVTEVLLNA